MAALLDVLEGDLQTKLDEKQTKAIRAFRAMLDEIEDTKKDARERPRPKTWWQTFLPG
jgi:hypothetical protein